MMWRPLILSVVCAFAAVGARAQQAERSEYFWGHMWGNGMWGGSMMFIFWLIVMVLLVLAVWWLVGSSRRDGANAREILDRRFAKGEIDEQEYKQRKDALDA